MCMSVPQIAVRLTRIITSFGPTLGRCDVLQFDARRGAGFDEGVHGREQSDGVTK